MLRWISLTLTVLALLLGLLTVVPVPDWIPWRWAVLAGEYGHGLVAIPVVAMAGGWIAWWRERRHGGPRARGTWIAVGATVFGVSACAALLWPSVAAAEIARRLPVLLAKRFGAVEIARPAFSFATLYSRRPDEPVTVETKTYAGELGMDVYRAAGRENSRPCVIVIHGGGWDSGDRGQLAHFNQWLAGRGYVVAAISYRLAPDHRWPAPRDDTLAAIAWLKRHARELGIDPGRLVLLGRSAGGQIAQTVAYTAAEPAIRGVVALYAPADLVFGYENTTEDDALGSPRLMRQYLGGTPASARANYESASAHYHVSAKVPPTLLLHGRLDTLVWYRHSERLAVKLADARVPHALVLLPWATHAFDYNLNGPGGQLTRFSLEWFLAAVTR